MRRYDGRMNGEKFLADTRRKIVHNLDMETKECKIKSIVESRDELPFTDLDDVLKEGYSICIHCGYLILNSENYSGNAKASRK